jgi:hypothetical protein
MAEQDLHEPDVDTLLQESGREAMSERVRDEAIIEAAGCACRVEGIASRLRGKMTGLLTIGEEPLLAATDPPNLAEHGPRRLGQGQDSLFVAFADDPQEHPLRVDSRDGQCDRLADPKAAGVGKGETAAVDGLLDRGNQAAAVRIASNIGKAFSIGLADFFFVSRGQS